MIVTSFVYCDHIDTYPVAGPKGQIYNLVDPLQMLTPYSIPGAFSFAISFGLQGQEFKNKGNMVRIDFCDEEGEIVVTAPNTPLPEFQSNGSSITDFGMCINLDLRNVLFKKRGIHRAKLYFNDNLAGEYPIMVTEAQ